MAKRIYSSDSAYLRKQVKSGRVYPAQLKGKALTYYNRVQGAAKARQKKVDATARVGKIKIPKDSNLYGIIEKAAQAKGMTVKDFTEQYADHIAKLLKGGDMILDRQSDRLMSDIRYSGKGRSVYVNFGDGFERIGKERAQLMLSELQSYAISSSDIFIVFFRTTYKLDGDIYFYMVPEEDYLSVEGEDLENLLDEYTPNITYVAS